MLLSLISGVAGNVDENRQVWEGHAGEVLPELQDSSAVLRRQRSARRRQGAGRRIGCVARISLRGVGRPAPLIEVKSLGAHCRYQVFPLVSVRAGYCWAMLVGTSAALMGFPRVQATSAVL